MICMPGIRLARHKHIREIDAIANHAACRGFVRQPDGSKFSALEWMASGAAFYIFDGGWVCAAPRSATEIDLHMAALPGFRGPTALNEGMRILDYMLASDSPFVRAFAKVERQNRAVRSILSAAGFRQNTEDAQVIEFVIERTA